MDSTKQKVTNVLISEKKIFEVKSGTNVWKLRVFDKLIATPMFFRIDITFTALVKIFGVHYTTISDWFKVKEHHLNVGEITIASNQKINNFKAMMKLLRKASLWFTFITGSASVPVNSGLQKLLDPITISK